MLESFQKEMKVGDLIYNKLYYSSHSQGYDECAKGVLINFIPATHSKQVSKVKVLTCGKVENWILQYCEVVNEE